MSLTPEEQRLINKTLSIRERIIDELFKSGIPSDTEDKEILLKALDSTDRTILGKARLKLDEQANKNQAQMQELVANVLLRSGKITKDIPAVQPSISKDISRTNIIEGDTTIGVINDSYSEFIERMQE